MLMNIDATIGELYYRSERLHKLRRDLQSVGPGICKAIGFSRPAPQGIAIEGINLGGRTNQIWISAEFREQHQHQAAVILFISFLCDLGSIISSVISAVASCWILLIYFIPSP